MSNRKTTRPRKARKLRQGIDPDSPIAKIAEHTGETPYDVQAALATLMAMLIPGYQADGMDYEAAKDRAFDVVWEWMRDAINDGKKIVDMAAEKMDALDE